MSTLSTVEDRPIVFPPKSTSSDTPQPSMTLRDLVPVLVVSFPIGGGIEEFHFDAYSKSSPILFA